MSIRLSQVPVLGLRATHLAVVRVAALFLVGCSAFATPGAARAELSRDEIARRAAEVEERVIAWRRDIHQHPELGNRETRTAALVAKHLRELGLEVETGVAHTGVVAVLRGTGHSLGADVPVVALRADMDALPVTEELDLPFASKVRTVDDGREVGVMHACGHDAHTAILMGVAEVLAGMREELPGTVKFLFQPAEEGTPAEEEGGAELMVREGALEDPRPDVVFGLHVAPFPRGLMAYRSGAFLAASDRFRLTVRGRQTHAASPWNGVDPITVAAQITLGLQTITSRQVDVTRAPAVLSIGAVHGGVRGNVIPDEVEMLGTLRTFDPQMREDIHARIERTASSIAEAAGATAAFDLDRGYPVTVNDPQLTTRAVGVLRATFGEKTVVEAPRMLNSEDFSYFAREVPGFYFALGVAPPDADPSTIEPNHSPRFFVDEAALVVGVRALTGLALDALSR